MRVVWDERRCDLCDSLTNDCEQIEGNYYVCNLCLAQYVDEDLRIELQHESKVMLDRCNMIADTRKN